jgi:cyclophilin family peptidyl-prolyl cis-trans isomerase
MEKGKVKKVTIVMYLILMVIVLGFMILLVSLSSKKLSIGNSACNIVYQPSVKSYSSYPNFCIDKNQIYKAEIETSYGNINLDLYPKAAPLAVNNFVFLSESGFYNNNIFNRIVKGFAVQGGIPANDTSGGPGYHFDDQINPTSLNMPSLLINAYKKKGYVYDYNVKSIPFAPYVIAMASSGANTDGSQFFITTGKDTQLNGLYTVFGKVTSGISVINKLNNAPVNVKAHHAPINKIYIKRILINP